MDLSQLRKRNAIASERLRAVCIALGVKNEVAESLVARVRKPVGQREVRALHLLEACADLIEACAGGEPAVEPVVETPAVDADAAALEPEATESAVEPTEPADAEPEAPTERKRRR